MKRQPKQIPIVVFVILLLAGPGLFFLGGETVPAIAAQSTGDTLTRQTPTSPPATAATRPPTQVATTEAKVWIGRLVSNTLGVTEGQGSIFRVTIDGLAGIPIELLTDDEVITGVSGSKPEYGPYTAEFAPVTEGTWVVNVPALGASIPVQADNYNLAVIEFVQIPAQEATTTRLPTPTPTSVTGQVWEGRLASETWGIGAQSSRLLVQVVGLSDYPVQLSTTAQVINTANTGQKPTELGPDVVEFAGLTPSKYIIEPLGLNSRFEVELKPNTETRVEFYPVAQPTATFTPIPATAVPTLPAATATPTATATPSETPLPADTPTPTVTSGPVEIVAPLPSPTSVTQWIGTIAQRQDTGSEAASVVARVLGIEGLPIRLQAVNSNVERRCITGQDEAGQDACTLKHLMPGLYIVSPEGLEQSLPVTVYENEKVEVVFDIGVLPPGVAGWEVRINKNTNSPQAVSKSEGTIRVRVEGRVGQVVALNSARGVERYCEVVPNPVLGSLVCEFGQLRPGVYAVEALNTKASQRLFVDGAGLAEVEFLPSAGPATLAQVQSPSEVGMGALPNRPTVTATPPSAQTIVATAPPPRPTATLTATPSPSPTPAFSWQGRVVETVDNVAGAIGVRAAGLKDHPVVLHSGSWQSPAQLTGTKPELGDYATEFGGLAQGEYTVELVDLAELTVTLGPGQFLLVEFRYDFVNPPQ